MLNASLQQPTYVKHNNYNSAGVRNWLQRNCHRSVFHRADHSSGQESGSSQLISLSLLTFSSKRDLRRAISATRKTWEISIIILVVIVIVSIITVII